MAEDGSRLEEDPAEQDILSRIQQLKAAGHTTRQIADELNRQGFTTRRGTAWRFSVRRRGPQGRIGGVRMRKKTGKTKPRPKRDRAWFERKVAELKAQVEKLPADRQEKN
jgi:hypothetical protein